MEKNQGFDLGTFLSEQRAAGQQEDSEGTFTISAERALTKLARFALPGDFDWVLKIVQAVNAWEAPELIVRQTRVATSFTFLPYKMMALDDQIVQCLQSGALNNTSPVHLLSMALRSLVDQAELSFVLATRHNGELGKPVFAGGDTSKMSAGKREEWTKLQRDGVRLTVSHFRGSESWTGRFIPTLSRVPRRDVEIARILDKRAFLSGTSIDLDGRCVTDIAKHSDWGHSKWFRPLRLAAWDRDTKSYNNKDHPVLTKRKTLEVLTPAVGFSDTWYYLTTAEWVSLRRTFRGNFIERPQPEQHSIIWLRFGVQVEHRTIFNTSEYTRLLLVLPADELRTDLSGLSVQIDNQEKKRVKTLSAHLAEELERSAKDLNNWNEALRVHATETNNSTASYQGEEDLSAGQSLATASITPELKKYRLPVGKFLRNLETFVEVASIREEILDRWAAELKADLLEIRKELILRVERDMLL